MPAARPRASVRTAQSGGSSEPTSVSSSAHAHARASCRRSPLSPRRARRPRGSTRRRSRRACGRAACRPARATCRPRAASACAARGARRGTGTPAPRRRRQAPLCTEPHTLLIWAWRQTEPHILRRNVERPDLRLDQNSRSRTQQSLEQH
eukprot:6211081-Pleurochrysis_carterae.AAC.10